MRGCSYRLGSTQARALSSQIGSKSAFGVEQGKCRHAQSCGSTIGNPFAFAAEYLTATDLGAWTQSQPRGKMFRRLPAAHVNTDLGNDLGEIGGNRDVHDFRGK